MIEDPNDLEIEDLPNRSSMWRAWIPAVLAGLALVAVIVVTSASRGGGSEGSGAKVEVQETKVPKKTIPLTRSLKVGVEGPDVKRLQLRLKELNFVPGPIDSKFGYLTEKAVWAYEKLVLGAKNSDVTGEVTPEMWAEMQKNIIIKPRRTLPEINHTEVYLPEQVMIVFWKDKPELITHISTGTGEQWCEEVTIDPGEAGNDTDLPITKGICGTAVTPPGVYFFYNRRLEVRRGALGTMYNPVYFNHGIAVHGATLIPNKPASHGCIRIPMYTAEIFPTKVYYNDILYIFDGIKAPEEYGQIDPPLDYDDPNYTTTTTSTTTTTTTTLPPPIFPPVTTAPTTTVTTTP